MKLIKALTSIAGLTTIAIPLTAITSCSNTETEHVTYMGSKKFEIEYGETVDLVFGVDKEFDITKDKVDIFCYDGSDDSNPFGYRYESNGRTVTVHIFVANVFQLTKIDLNLDIRFRTKSWTQIIKNFKFRYTLCKDNCPKFFVNEDTTLKLENYGTNNPDVKYSLNKGAWTQLDGSLKLSTGDRLLLKGNNPSGFSQNTGNYSTLRFDGGQVDLFGNVMGLLNDNAETSEPAAIPNEYCFYALFQRSNIKFVDPSFLPSIELQPYCYQEMFEDCKKLEYMPDLPAAVAKEYCYLSMFQGCSKLKQTGYINIDTTDVGCCQSMFQDCTSLYSAQELIAHVMFPRCYESMFQGCTNLEIAPLLGYGKTSVEGITQGADYCFANMFRNCTKLHITNTNHPYDESEYRLVTIPATWQNNYSDYMFYGTADYSANPEAGKTYYCYKYTEE